MEGLHKVGWPKILKKKGFSRGKKSSIMPKVQCYFKLQWSDLPPHQHCSNTNTPRLAQRTAHGPTMKPYSDPKTVSLHRAKRDVSVLLLGHISESLSCSGIFHSYSSHSPKSLGSWTLLCLQRRISENCKHRP